ncbi:MAG: hypothetical protein QXT50_05030 [Thermofilum sp.]
MVASRAQHFIPAGEVKVVTGEGGGYHYFPRGQPCRRNIQATLEGLEGLRPTERP